MVNARTDAGPIYAALSDLEAQRREVKGKLDVVLKKHGTLMKAVSYTHLTLPTIYSV